MAELTVITNNGIRYTIPVKEVGDDSDDPHTWDMHLWRLYDQQAWNRTLYISKWEVIAYLLVPQVLIK